MRIFGHRSARLRAVLAAASLLAAAGCGAGSASSGTAPIPNASQYGLCDPGTQVQLASPQPGQTGVNPNTTRIEIVANGSNNTLYQSYTNFDVVLVDNFGNRITGGALSLYSDPRGIQPYPSDFYYTSNIAGLGFGTNYSAYLNIFNSNCQQLPYLGSFST